MRVGKCIHRSVDPRTESNDDPQQTAGNDGGARGKKTDGLAESTDGASACRCGLPKHDHGMCLSRNGAPYCDRWL